LKSITSPNGRDLYLPPIRGEGSNWFFITLEKLLSVLIFENGLLKDHSRMRKTVIFGQPLESNGSQKWENFRKGLRAPGFRCPVIACK
jgi:hypothetical protein